MGGDCHFNLQASGHDQPVISRDRRLPDSSTLAFAGPAHVLLPMTE
jgi:hypothetical protein